MFRHKGTYHTNEAKGAESAESADAAIMNNDPNFTETIDESKKEWLIWGVAIWLWEREGLAIREEGTGQKCTLLYTLEHILKISAQVGGGKRQKILETDRHKKYFLIFLYSWVSPSVSNQNNTKNAFRV